MSSDTLENYYKGYAITRDNQVREHGKFYDINESTDPVKKIALEPTKPGLERVFITIPDNARPIFHYVVNGNSEDGNTSRVCRAGFKIGDVRYLYRLEPDGKIIFEID